MRRRTAASSRDDDDSSKYSKHHRGRHGSGTSGDFLPSGVTLVTGIVIIIVSIVLLQQHFLPSSNSTTEDASSLTQQDQVHVQDRSSIAQSSLLSAEEDEQLERDAVSGIRYHVVFSTDCSPYQHWQSYLVYYTAMKVKQPGHVTRIASGCDADQAAAMQQWFERDIQFMSPRRFHLQLTPHFSDIKNEQGQTIGDYKFFNKPFGLKYWMEHSPQLHVEKDQPHEIDPSVLNDVVILIDPDMGLLRPITVDFSHEKETVISKHRREHMITTTVGPGKPAAQVYGFGAQWARLDLEKIAGFGTPAKDVSNEDALLYYPVGPPYLATVKDMYQIAVTWSSFVPKVYEQYPHLLAEMFAFCIAAAHLKLPHQLISSLMISDTGSVSEGWPLIDVIPAEEVCRFASNPDRNHYPLPNVVHLCQRYAIGDDWFFSKRRVPSDVYDCESPLFQDPPENLASTYNYAQFPHGQRKDLSKKEAVRTTFVICYLNAILNEAATFYKKNACAPETINLEKTRNLAHSFLPGGQDNVKKGNEEPRKG